MGKYGLTICEGKYIVYKVIGEYENKRDACLKVLSLIFPKEE